MKIYIYTFQDLSADDPNPVVVVKELREDLARELAEEHLQDRGHDPVAIELQLIEEFDSRDRDVLYSTVEHES